VAAEKPEPVVVEHREEDVEEPYEDEKHSSWDEKPLHSPQKYRRDRETDG